MSSLTEHLRQQAFHGPADGPKHLLLEAAARIDELENKLRKVATVATFAAQEAGVETTTERGSITT